jgi:predicted ArsR family transcriptional regulator
VQGRGLNWLEAVADPTRLHIVRALIEVPDATLTELLVDWASAQTMRRHLEALVSTGVIDERPGESDGRTPGRPAARFSLVPEVRAGLLPALEASLREGQQPSSLL